LTGRIGRMKILLPLAALLAVGAFFLYRDLSLPERAKEAGTLRSLPDVEAQGLSIDRTIKGERWLMEAQRAEKSGGTVRVWDFRVRRSSPSGRPVMELTAREGLYDEDGTFVKTLDFSGTFRSAGRDYVCSGGEAVYHVDQDRWDLARGVKVSRDGFTAQGDGGVIHRDGRISLRGGIRVTLEVR